MDNSIKYESVAKGLDSLGSVIPKQLVVDTTNALRKLEEALGGDVSGYVASRLHMNMTELCGALAAEQVEGVALAMYNIEMKSQAVIIGDQTGIGKGRQAAAMIRYGLLSGYLPIFFTDKYTLFSDMYRDCKALGIKDARPLIINKGVSVVDFDEILEETDTDSPDDIWSPQRDEENIENDSDIMRLYQRKYKIIYQAPKTKVFTEILNLGDFPSGSYDYLMLTYSQLKDVKRDMTRLDFLLSLCQKHRVLFIFDEAHKSSSVSDGNLSVITQCVNHLLAESPRSQCLFLSATFAKRPESLITFMRRTALSALATENTLEKAMYRGGVPMQEYISTTLASEGQMIRREHSNEGIPLPTYTYLDDDLPFHSELFDKVMFFFREIVKLSAIVSKTIAIAHMMGILVHYKCYPTLAQLFYINKVLLLALKAQRVAEIAIRNVKEGRSVVIAMSDTLECVLHDVTVFDNGSVSGDISTLLLRLLDRTVRSSDESYDISKPIFDLEIDNTSSDMSHFVAMIEEIRTYYNYIKTSLKNEVFHLPVSPIDIIRQLITQETFISPDGSCINIRFEECTGRDKQLEYLSPEGNDDYVNATIVPRKKYHSNHTFNDFQNNKLDVILINACGAIGASAHAIETNEVPDTQVRQRKMLIVQNDLDVNIDIQKRGRINRTGQRMDLPPLYEYIITAIPSEKRLNMMLRAKLRSLSANTAAHQDQDKGQADFVDISNKYGNQVATDYINEHIELAWVLGLKGKVTATKLLARIAMLSVDAQQEIVDDLMVSYLNLESELRRINQWDLEREYRDFEADFVCEELFTTAKASTKLGGCSYLTTYRCKQKTFPYTYERLHQLCDEAKLIYGPPYKENKSLQKEIREYYKNKNQATSIRFSERRRVLYADSQRILTNYCQNTELANHWLEQAKEPLEQWAENEIAKINQHEKSKLILRKLNSYCNDYRHLLDREKKELKRYATEKKHLLEVLSKAIIGQGYTNISNQLSSEECPNRAIAVLRDIRFGKDERSRFLPSNVEFIFALSAVHTEIRINVVHNKKWSNYERLREILNSEPWIDSADEWSSEIKSNNSKVVERKIITGNILGAYVHPAIDKLKPRFITFSLKEQSTGLSHIKNGLLLPLNESKIRDALQTISIPLQEGIKYANNPNTSYIITGLGVDFSLLPYRISHTCLKFVLNVETKQSKAFIDDPRFENIKKFFKGNRVTSIYDEETNSISKRKILMHYATEQIDFESTVFQTIMQTLSQLDAVIIIPRDQMTGKEIKGYISQSEKEDNNPWPKCHWWSQDAIPMPPIRENLLLRISAPILPEIQKGKPVYRHSAIYLLAKETLDLSRLSLKSVNTLNKLRRAYIKWKSIADQQEQPMYIHNKPQKILCRNLIEVIENRSKKAHVEYTPEVSQILQEIIDSEYLVKDGLFLSRFEDEMLFLSPDIDQAQDFLDSLPCSIHLDGIRKCIQDYIDGKTDIINSPDRF